jgi:ENTS family enterobactin (siderophore) exporter
MAPPAAAVGRRAGLLLDLAPLRASRDFALLFTARLVSMIGVGILGVALSVQVFGLTGSSVHVALVGACFALGMVTGLLAGGRLADRGDRRVLILRARAAYLAVGLVLLGNALLPQPMFWPIALAAVLSGITGGISAPALMAATPTLVAREHMPAAVALGSLSMQAGGLLGPAIAGAALGTLGPSGTYALCVAIAAAVPLLILKVRPLVPRPGPHVGPPRPSAGGLLEGLRFAATDRRIAGLLLIDIGAMILARPVPLFPQIDIERYGGGPAEVGWLHAAVAVGAFVAAMTSGWVGRPGRAGMVLLGGFLLWGLGIMGLGLSPALAPALICLAVAGYGGTTAEILRGAQLQIHTPDALRGRVSSLWMMLGTVVPALGGLVAGVAASWLGVGVAVTLGAALCLLTTLAVAVLLPAGPRS